MKLITKSSLNVPLAGSTFSSGRKLIVFFLFLLSIYNLPVNAQVAKSPSWWFGVAGGGNYNAYNGYTSTLNTDIHPAQGFNRGEGYGAYVAGVIEYHQPGSVWSIMVQQGLDNRYGTFKESGRELNAKISYFTVEPSLVINIPHTGFHTYVGPRFGFLWGSTFTYKEPNKPDYPQKNVNPEAYIRNLRKNPISLQVGLGYNIKLNPTSAGLQTIIAPFITYLPSLGQNIRTIESMKLNSLRAGIVLKAGRVSRD